VPLRAGTESGKACDGFFSQFKAEWFYSGNWQSTKVEQFVQALHSFIRWYNKKGLKVSLGTRSPIDYRRSLGLLV
jgi:transposase InsO family protein